MSEGTPQIVICHFHVAPGQEEAMIALCREHDRTLRHLGLVTEVPTQLYPGADDQGRPYLVKIFEWRSEAAVEAAHKHPEVQVHWEAMEPLCEPRDGRPSMEFPHVSRVAIA